MGLPAWSSRLICSSADAREQRVVSVEAEDRRQSFVDAPQFLRREVPTEFAESRRVHGSQLFDQYAGRLALEVDLGSEGCPGGR